MREKFIASIGRVLISPDLPKANTTALGLFIPPQNKALHFERDADNYMKAFARGEFQVVSGTVIAHRDEYHFPLQLPTVTVPKGIESISVGNGVSLASIPFAPPVVGDSVWFGWRKWAALETMERVVFYGDSMIGDMSIRSIYLIEHEGQYRACGPQIILEPIPQVHHEGGWVTERLGHVKNAGIVRCIGDVSMFPNCHDLKVGEVVAYGSRDKIVCPVPFSDKEWINIHASQVLVINPSWVHVPENLHSAWEDVKITNNEIARIASKNTEGESIIDPLLDIDWNAVDYNNELEKKRTQWVKDNYKKGHKIS